MKTQNLRRLKVVAILLSLMLALPATFPTAFADHREGHEQGNQGNGNGNGNSNGNSGGNGNQGNVNQGNVNRGNGNSESQRRQEIAQASRRAEVQRSRDQKKTRENRPEADNQQNHRTDIRKSENAKWWKHPSDTRGQGNNGKPRMLNPYGHDKDSDRKELYGNNGRPIREKDPSDEEPLPVEEPVVEETPVLIEEPLLNEVMTLEDLLAFDFSTLGDQQEEWIANWYQSTLDWYYQSTLIQSYYTYEKWQSMWEYHFYPGGTGENVTGIRVGYMDNLNYSISADETWSGEPLEVTTTLYASQDYTVRTYTYDPLTGTLTWGTETIQTGDILSQTTTTAYYNETTGTYQISADIDDSGVPQQQNIAYFVDMDVTVTDTSTQSTATSTYDQSLYLYRCPYGKVYNKLTDEPIVNAKITVFFEDGSIVPLDKALNPTATNPQYSDATGRYGCKLQTGRTYYIETTAEGYEPYRSEPFTEKWHVLREDIPMTPLPKAPPMDMMPELPDSHGVLQPPGEVAMVK